jgi:hypothetical protein
MRVILLSLMLGGLAQGRTLVLVADPNACVQQDWSRMVPFTLPEADPNRPYGAILGPMPGDPNAWEVPTGPFKRECARACDPEADEFTVRYLGGTSTAEVQLDRSAGRWSFAAEVVEHQNVWQFEADDGRAQRIVTIVAWGRKNEPPVLY